MSRIFTSAILACISCGVALGETPATLPSFEAAAVQVHTGMDGQPNAQFLVGRVDIQAFTMKQMLMAAFNIGNGVADKLLEGGPSWMDSVRYDIVAKADAKTPIATLRLMLQSLLAERFQFTYHHADKVMPVYALVLAKGGHKLQPTTSADPQNCVPGEGVETMIHLACHNMTVPDIVAALPTFAPRYFDCPVVNGTDIKGAFDFKLDWTPVGGGGGDGQHANSDSADIAATTVFDAVLQLGFKLEKRKQPVAVIMIDRLERVPTEN